MVFYRAVRMSLFRLIRLLPLIVWCSFSAAAFSPSSSRCKQSARTSSISTATTAFNSRSTHLFLILSAAKTEPPATATTSNDNKNPSSSISKLTCQIAVLDGAEWISVRNRLLAQEEARNKQLMMLERTEIGVLAAVAGTVDGERVTGMQVLATSSKQQEQDDSETSDTIQLLDQGVEIYKESLAKIPDGISDTTAVWTLLQSLSRVHCVLPVLRDIGGSSSDVTMMKNAKIVVLGGNPEAVSAAQALQKLGNDVTIVSETKPSSSLSGDTSSSSTLQHLTPAVGELNLGFSSVLDQFDAVLDTLGNEHDDEAVGASYATPSRSSVVALLRDRHECHTYASIQPHAQSLITQHGLLWGPGKTKEYTQSLQKRALKATAAQFPSPTGFGSTVQTLLQAGVTFPPPSSFQKNEKEVYVRGWSLKDFWEYTTWPRDASTDVRFGLPVVDDLLPSLVTSNDEDAEDGDEEEERMISAPPMRAGSARPGGNNRQEADDEADSPYVMSVTGVKGLQEKIVNDQTTCLLFLSAPFCRTCRYLKPKYQRMARKQMEQNENDDNDDGKPINNVVFAKSEAIGQIGKELGKALGVDSVPSFLLFKKGRRFGKPIAVSRLPSAKLDLAVRMLQNDEDWNEASILASDKDEYGGFRGGSGQEKRPPRRKLF